MLSEPLNTEAVEAKCRVLRNDRIHQGLQLVNSKMEDMEEHRKIVSHDTRKFFVLTETLLPKSVPSPICCRIFGVWFRLTLQLYNLRSEQ